MKKISGLVLAFSFLFIVQIHSQITDYDLSSFKLPDLKRQILETNLNFNGNNTYNKYPVDPNTQISNYKNNNYNGVFSLNYDGILNNAKWQNETQFGFNFASNYNSMKEGIMGSSKNYTIAPVLNYTQTNRYYYTNNNFIEINLLASASLNRYSYNENRENNNYETENADHSVNGTVGLPIKTGWGRIEPIQDARHAIYIIDELKKLNRLSNIQNKDSITHLAEFISEIKNKRFFDTRLQQIYEIEAVDSFLFAHGYCNNRDSRYFTTLNDNWVYGSVPFRNSGSRFSLVFYPAYLYSNTYRHDVTVISNGNEIDPFYAREDMSVYGIMLTGGFEYTVEKPINLFWQNTTQFNGYLGTFEGKQKDYENGMDNTSLSIPDFQFECIDKLGFYPNTRTSLNLQLSAKYIYLFDNSNIANNITGASGQGVKLGSNININYYISPKFRLNFSSSLFYIWQDSKDNAIINFNNIYSLNQISSTSVNNNFMTKNLEHQFSLSLTYSIF
jgi:hypothetical protein